jgi:hypothetical protein
MSIELFTPDTTSVANNRTSMVNISAANNFKWPIAEYTSRAGGWGISYDNFRFIAGHTDNQSTYVITSESGAPDKGTGISLGLCTKIAKTNYGIGLLFATGVLMISDTDQGSPGVYLFSTWYNGSNYWRLHMWDGKYSKVVNIYSHQKTSYDDQKSYLTTKAGKTVLIPVVFDCGTYTPNMFFTPFTQRRVPRATGWEKVSINDEEYLYDGIIALKG